ncbi:MAG: hypothetical protein NTW04_00435 [Elusimicrobia bacterium]|nr:hypothetical protein [Elusimicrobiota bacterium]
MKKIMLAVFAAVFTAANLCSAQPVADAEESVKQASSFPISKFDCRFKCNKNKVIAKKDILVNEKLEMEIYSKLNISFTINAFWENDKLYYSLFVSPQNNQTNNSSPLIPDYLSRALEFTKQESIVLNFKKIKLGEGVVCSITCEGSL